MSATRQTSASNRASTTASPATLYELLADGSTWLAWAPPMKSFRLEIESPDGGEGVGAVRVWNSGIRVAVEETTIAEPPTRFGYKLLRSPLTLVRDYEAVVELTPEGTGSTIVWSATFRPLVPGTGLLWSRLLSGIYGVFLKGLVDYAEKLDGDNRGR